MKQVRETKAGQSISAFIVLKKGKHVASVQFHYSDSGVVTVDVWDGNNDPQQGKAGGYGYDKAAAALSGLTIDGHKMYNHCGRCEKTERLLKKYISGKLTEDEAKKKAEKIGAHFANYHKDDKTGEWKYSSLYMYAGLERLRFLGYNVIQAI